VIAEIMGSLLIPYKSDDNSSKYSELATDRPIHQTKDKKELKGYGDILYVGGH